MNPLLSPLSDFPEEAGIVGSLLVDYAELEFWYASSLCVALSDVSKGFRVFYRIRSESAKINVADALLRPAFAEAGLGDAYSEGLGALRHCLKIRNQFAHCHWRSDKPKLYVLAMEDFADKADSNTLPFQPITLELLKEQREYFTYTSNILYFLQTELRKFKKISETFDYPRPQKLPLPKLDSRPDPPRPASPFSVNGAPPQ